jgi:hypothetical protein
MNGVRAETVGVAYGGVLYELAMIETIFYGGQVAIANK